MFLCIKIAKNTRWKFYEISSFFPTLFNWDQLKLKIVNSNLNYKNVTN